jgi:hypothetical protein
MEVFDPGTSQNIFQANYPSFSENALSGELEEDENPIQLGIMGAVDDVQGLQSFLVKNRIILEGDTVALVGSYADGGSVDGERDVYAYMDQMSRKWGMDEATRNYLKQFMVKHDQNADVDQIMMLADKIAAIDNKKRGLEHVAEAVLYSIPDQPLFGRIAIGDVKSLFRYGRFLNDSLDRLNQLGILPLEGKIDMQKVEELQKVWDSLEIKDNPAANRLIEIYFDKILEPEAVTNESYLGRDAVNALISVCRKIQGIMSSVSQNVKLPDAAGQAISETINPDQEYHNDGENTIVRDVPDRDVPQKHELAKPEYTSLRKKFKDLYNADAEKVYASLLVILKDGITDGDYTHTPSFKDAIKIAIAQNNGNQDISGYTYPDDLILALTETELLETIRLKKADRVDAANSPLQGLVNIHSINKPIPKKTDLYKLFDGIVADDPLRPAMTGVLQDSKRQCLVGTNAHILAVLPHKVTGENRIIDIKTGKPMWDKIEDQPRFPDYSVVIPDGEYSNEIVVKNVNLKSWWPKINGLVAALKLCDSEGAISCCIRTEFTTHYFNPMFLQSLMLFFMKSGIDVVNIELGQKSTKGMVIRAAGVKEMLTLIMPMFAEDRPATPVYDIIDLAGAEYVPSGKKKAAKKAVAPKPAPTTSHNAKVAKMAESIAGGFTKTDTINKAYRELKEKIGEKKAQKYFEQVDRLMPPLRNEIVDYRENGIVVKQGGKYIFHALIDTSTKKWGLGFTSDVSDQFGGADISDEQIKALSEHESYFGLNIPESALTRQIVAIKKTNANAIVLMEINEFIEAMGQDAIDVSQAVGLRITKREDGLSLCGFDKKMLDEYLPKIIKATGKTVALVEDQSSEVFKRKKGATAKRDTPKEEPKEKKYDLSTETALVPEIIADYIAREAVEENVKTKSLPDNRKLSMVKDLTDHLASRAYEQYQSSEHFRSQLNAAGNKGRDNLYMFMRHWSEAFIGKLKLDNYPTAKTVSKEEADQMEEDRLYEEALAQYNNSNTEQKAALRKIIEKNLARHDQAEDAIGMGLEAAKVRAGRRFMTAIGGSVYKHIGSNDKEDREPQMSWSVSDIVKQGFDFTGYVTSNAAMYNTRNIAKELDIPQENIRFNYLGNHQWGVFKKKGSKGSYKEVAMLPGGDKKETKPHAPKAHKEKPAKKVAPKPTKEEKPKRTERAIIQDKHIKAMKPGKHTSEDGGTYYEYRENHTDQDRRKKFAKGGSASDMSTDLAIEFSKMLSSDLSAEEMKEVVAKNKTSEYSNACASHDYLDSNITMDEAFQKVTKRQFDFNNEADIDLINEAWSIAKKNDFYTGKKKGGRLTRANKEYKFFVVNEDKKVVAGFEYREDAKDFTKEVDAAAGLKTYTASWIKINLKYDPYDYENWSNLFKSGGTVSELYGEDLKKKFFHK